MNGIIWLWKHRHCWKQLKYLYEHRVELKLILGNIHVHDDRPGEYQADPDADPERIEKILECLQDFDRIPLARPWKVEPPPAPKQKEPNPFQAYVDKVEAPFLKEKSELLKTHPGWLVAYADATGERIALEPTFHKLMDYMWTKFTEEDRIEYHFHKIAV